MTIFHTHPVLPGINAHVMIPRHMDHFQKVPWLNITAGIVSVNPDANRQTAAILRTLADELDQAWAAVDRRAELDAQPEDRTQFTALNPEEDAAMDNLAAGLPAFAPRVED